MTSDTDASFARLAVEHWKLIQVLHRLVHRLPIESQERVMAQIRFATGQLKTIITSREIELATFEGRRFEPNLPVIAVNAHEFASDAPLLVAETVEPAVVMGGRVLQLGKVLLSEETSNAPRD